MARLTLGQAIQLYNQSGNLWTDNQPLIPAVPTSPSSLLAAAVSSTSIDLTWIDNADNETAINIYQSSDGVSFSLVSQRAANATTYRVVGLVASTQYYFRVTASNATGESAASNIDSDTTSVGSAVGVASFVATAKGNKVSSGGTITINAGDVVHFEATSFIDPDGSDFIQNRHRFDFGDTSEISGGNSSWAYPTNVISFERRKNVWIGGGCTAHYYAETGTYTVKHKIRTTGSDEYVSPDITVIVRNNDIVYSGANTYCLHYGGTFANAPVGAIIRDVQASGWPTFSSDTRYYLQAGDDFSTAGIIDILGGRHRGRIEKYEAGADPVVASVASGYYSPNTPSELDWPTDWVVQDINARHFSTRNVTDGICFVRGQIREGAYIGSGIGYSYDQAPQEVLDVFRHNRMSCLIETDVLNNDTVQKSTVYLTGLKPVIMGTRLRTPTTLNASNTQFPDPEHINRNFQCYMAVFQHNQYDPPAPTGGRTWIRIQSNGVGDVNEDLFASNEQSRYNVIGRCDFIGMAGIAGNIAVWLAPENDTYQLQLVADSSFFDCHFIGWTSGSEGAMGGRGLGYGGIVTDGAGTFTTGFKYPGGVPEGSNGPYHQGLNLTNPTDFI